MCRAAARHGILYTVVLYSRKKPGLYKDQEDVEKSPTLVYRTLVTVNRDDGLLTLREQEFLQRPTQIGKRDCFPPLIDGFHSTKAMI